MNLTKLLELTIASKEDNTKLLELEDLLKQYIAEETVKQKGGNKEKQRLLAARRYLKESEKINMSRPALHGSWMIDGKQYISNGYSGIELVSVIEGLKEIPKDIEPLKLLDVINDTEQKSKIKVDTPNITALKIQLKNATAEAKAKKVKINKIKSGLIKIGNSIIDVKLLLDTIAMFPTDKLEYYVSENRSYVLIKDDLGNRAIICPMKMTAEQYDNMDNDNTDNVA